MAYVTGTALTNPLAKILWSDKLHVETLKEMYFTMRGLTREEEGDENTYERRGGAPIVVKRDFNKSRGQRIRLALQKQLTTDVGVASRSTGLASYTHGTTGMNGNEETMELYDMEVIVEQRKHAVGFDTPEIQNLRTNFRMDKLAAARLRDWMKQQKELGIIDAFIDGNTAHVIAESLASVVAHPNRYVAGVAGAAASTDAPSSTDLLNVAELRRMYAWARYNAINPVSAEGDECYVLLAPVFATNTLDADDTYRSSLNNALPRTRNHPLFDRADMKFGGIYIHEYNRVPNPATGDDKANIWQCMLLGADAIVLGLASKERLVRKKEDDYEDDYGVGIKSIWGCARADFQNAGNSTTLNQSSAQWDVYASSNI